MERDRVASLLVEMASHGVVDFAGAKILDRKWQLKIKWLARSYSLKKSSEVVKLSVLRYTGALGFGSADLFNESWEKISDMLEDYDKVSRPWIEREDTK